MRAIVLCVAILSLAWPRGRGHISISVTGYETPNLDWSAEATFIFGPGFCCRF